jgi:hypothetical protein
VQHQRDEKNTLSNLVIHIAKKRRLKEALMNELALFGK